MSVNLKPRAVTRKKSAPPVRITGTNPEGYMKRMLGSAAVTLATHAQRLDAIEDMTKTVQEDLREMRKSQDEHSRYVNQRIDTVQKTVTEKLDTQTRELTQHFDAGIAEVKTLHENNGKRITSLENWRYVIIGGACIVGFIISDILVRVFYGPVGQFLAKLIGH